MLVYSGGYFFVSLGYNVGCIGFKIMCCSKGFDVEEIYVGK